MDTESLFIIGLFLLPVAGLSYAISLGRLKKSLNATNPAELQRMGLGTITDLFGPTYGTKQMQAFLYKKLFLNHPDPLVVNAGKNLYRSAVGLIMSLLLMISSVVLNAALGS